MSQAYHTLTEDFSRYFNVALAITEAQRSAVFRIRYNVYCNEFNYEQEQYFPNQEEKDAFDPVSLHALITHKSSGLPAGCVRLVAPTCMEEGNLLPFEKHCGTSLNPDYLEKLHSDRNKACEISRFAVDRAFRRRSVEKITRYGEMFSLDCSQSERRTFALIAVAGFLAATSMTIISERTNIFAMMEPFLPRFLSRSGIIFKKSGPDINYRGLRAPYFTTAQSIMDNLHPALTEFYTEINARLLRDYSEQHLCTSAHRAAESSQPIGPRSLTM